MRRLHESCGNQGGREMGGGGGGDGGGGGRWGGGGEGRWEEGRWGVFDTRRIYSHEFRMNHAALSINRLCHCYSIGGAASCSPNRISFKPSARCGEMSPEFSP